MAKKDETPKIDANKITKENLKMLLDKNKADHYNYVENISTKVSSGSLFLDSGVALCEGIHRFCGPAGAGKTSEAAEVIKNFLNGEKKGKALWVKAEGRLGENIQKRSGVKFVFTLWILDTKKVLYPL
jgi:RecA/RadA recombinase